MESVILEDPDNRAGRDNPRLDAARGRSAGAENLEDNINQNNRLNRGTDLEGRPNRMDPAHEVRPAVRRSAARGRR